MLLSDSPANLNSVEPNRGPNPTRIPGWTLFDKVLVWAIAVYGAMASLLLLLTPKLFLPAEDAAILFQFSRNLAVHGAITFIPMGPRAEGATDFAWMVLISLGMKLHIDPMWLVAVLNVASILLLADLLIRIAGRKPKLLSLFFVVGTIALMPQIVAAIGGFSSLPFAYLLIAFVYFFLQRNDAAMALAGLVLCLFRPDGVVFVVPLLIAGLVIYPARLRRLALYTALFVVPGLCYFVWRWHYFGQMLPLPFLVKASAPRIWHLFVETSLKQWKLLGLFSLVVLVYAMRGRLADARNRAVLLCIVVLPNLFYLAMRLDQNVGHRFFIYLPIGTALLIAMNWTELRPKAPTLLRLSVLLWVMLIARIWFTEGKYAYVLQYDNRRAIAQEMANLPPGKLILSEAGLVTYYSHWAVYDPWGLNTADYAKRLFKPSDVEQIKPDLILVYTGGDIDCFRHADWDVPYTTRTWKHMTRNVLAGADLANYQLWLLPAGNTRYRSWKHEPGWEGDQECWLVRKNGVDEAQLTSILARHGGLPAQDYLAHSPGPGPGGNGLEIDGAKQPVDNEKRTGLRLVKHWVGEAWRSLDE